MSSYSLSLPDSNPVVTLTRPKPYLWIIELHNGQDSRLTDHLIDGGLKPALDQVESQWEEARDAALASKSKDKYAGAGALIIVGNRKQDKFFSNGLDLQRAMEHPAFFPAVFDPMLSRLLTFPIPTIAAINGHCFAGGFMLSLACDYRVMTDGKHRNAWLCMNEVLFGSRWPLSFGGLLRAKVGDARLQREIALEGRRFTPQEALELRLIDHIAPSIKDAATGQTTAAVITKATEVADSVAPVAKAGVWGGIKEDIYTDVLNVIETGKDVAGRPKL
jgi:enoyl-CoA hydratase/carnithine racemase